MLLCALKCSNTDDAILVQVSSNKPWFVWFLHLYRPCWGSYRVIICLVEHVSDVWLDSTPETLSYVDFSILMSSDGAKLDNHDDASASFI